jgi:hypothetical protein
LSWYLSGQLGDRLLSSAAGVGYLTPISKPPPRLHLLSDQLGMRDGPQWGERLALHRQLPNPARTTQHLARRHRLDLDGEHGELFREQFTSPEQLHRFAHEPTEQRAILAVLLDPFIDQILHILGQLPDQLHPIVLAEAALALRLADGRILPATNRPDDGDRR